jgi:hypothetical protein
MLETAGILWVMLGSLTHLSEYVYRILFPSRGKGPSSYWQ